MIPPFYPSNLNALHSRDTGGMSIIIAPIFGRKELTLVHRDDGRLLYNCSAPIAHPDCVKYPLAAFIRVWKTVIERGDILVLPPGKISLLAMIK